MIESDNRDKKISLSLLTQREAKERESEWRERKKWEKEGKEENLSVDSLENNSNV